MFLSSLLDRSSPESAHRRRARQPRVAQIGAQDPHAITKLQLQQVEVVQLVVVLGDVSSLGRVAGPGDEVLHGPRDEERGVRDDRGPDADVAAPPEPTGRHMKSALPTTAQPALQKRRFSTDEEDSDDEPVSH